MDRKYYKIAKLPEVKSKLERDNVSKTRKKQTSVKTKEEFKDNQNRKVIILESLKIKNHFIIFRCQNLKLKQLARKKKKLNLNLSKLLVRTPMVAWGQVGGGRMK